MAIRAVPIASGASGPAGPESAITERKMKVPTSSVMSLGGRVIGQAAPITSETTFRAN